MCGLVGIISQKEMGLFAKDQEIFSNMLVINSLRGNHSTGIFGVNLREKSTEWAKATGSPYAAFSHSGFKEVFSRIPSKYRAIVGHGRFATKGLVTGENAHPYEVKNITLVHNGTLVNGYKFPEFHKFPVDSQFFAWEIAHKGIKEVYKEIEGAVATIFYDSDTDKIHAIRNDERPLWLLEGRDKILLSSEEATLAWLKIKFPEEKFESPKYLQEHLLYNFNVGQGKDAWDTTKLEPFKKSIVVPQHSYLKEEEDYYFKNKKRNKQDNNIIKMPAKKTKDIKSFNIGNNLISIGSELNIIVDDVVPIFNIKNEIKRLVIHGTFEEDIHSSLADFIVSVSPDLYKEEDFYNCDYINIKVNTIAKRENTEKYTVYCQLSSLVFRNGKDIVNGTINTICEDCNSFVMGDSKKEIVVNGVKRTLCLSCAGN